MGSDFWLCRLLFLHGHEALGLDGGEAHLEHEAPDFDLVYAIAAVRPDFVDLVPLVAEGEHPVREHEMGVPLAVALARGAVAVGGECRFYRPRTLVVVLEHHCSEDHRVFGVPLPAERRLGDAEEACGLGDVHVVREGDVHHVAGAALGDHAASALVAGDAGQERGGDLGELFSPFERTREVLEAVGPEGRTAVVEDFRMGRPHSVEEREADRLAPLEGVVDGDLYFVRGVMLCRPCIFDFAHEAKNDEDEDDEHQGTGRNGLVHGFSSLLLRARGVSAGRYIRFRALGAIG